MNKAIIVTATELIRAVKITVQELQDPVQDQVPVCSKFQVPVPVPNSCMARFAGWAVCVFVGVAFWRIRMKSRLFFTWASSVLTVSVRRLTVGPSTLVVSL